MSWVVSLVGCGGPAVSRCGHETRRHRVRGALFASVFASVLLAACGGGSGGNLTTSSETEPGPPGPSPLTATGDGDGQGSESENEQQQQIIIVNQEEEQQQEIVVNIQPEPEESEEEEEQQQEIVVNIQPEPEESEEEEEQQQKIVVNIQSDNQEPEEESESESDNNNEETPQQLTIIEEEVFEHRPPEDPKYPASPQQQNLAQDLFFAQSGDLFGFDYWGIITGGSSKPLTFNFGSQIMDNLNLEDRGKIAFPHPLPAKFYELQTRLSQPSLYDDAEAKQEFGNYKNSIAYKSATKGVKNITAHYNGEVGGIYLYKGQPGSFQSNANLSVVLSLQDRRNEDNLLQYKGTTIRGHIGTDITMGGDTFYGFIISHPVDTEDGRFIAEKPTFGFRYGGLDGNVTPNIDHGTGTINGWFSNDGRKGTSKEDMPTQLFGKIEVSGFSKNGESGEGNQLKAIFVTERQ